MQHDVRWDQIARVFGESRSKFSRIVSNQRARMNQRPRLVAKMGLSKPEIMTLTVHAKKNSLQKSAHPAAHIKKKFITGVTNSNTHPTKNFKRGENFSNRTSRHEFLYSRRYQNTLLSLFITYTVL